MKIKRAVLTGISLVGAVVLGGCRGSEKKAAEPPQTSVVTESESTDAVNETESQSKAESETEAESGTDTEEVPETVLNKTEAQTEAEKQMYESYASIVERYQEAFEQVKSTGMPENVPEYMNAEFYASVSYQELDSCGFQLYDLNCDGTPELFIGLYTGGTDADLFIYDVYTRADNISVRLMDDIGYRGGTCIICEGGIIKDMSSGSAVDSMQDYHCLPENGRELELVDSISAHGDIESGELHYYHDHDGNAANEISEEEYFKIEDSYVAVTGLASYEATQDNIQQLRDGSLTIQAENADALASESKQQDASGEYFAELQALEEKEQELYANVSGDMLSVNEAVNTACTWWDDELNEIYQTLKAGLSQGEADALVAEELEWIDYRDSEAQKAWDEFADAETGNVGTGATAAYIGKKLEITKERVYELAHRVYN